MAMMTYEPHDVMTRLQQEINRLFDRGDESSSEALSDWMPSVDILEYDNHFKLFVDLPGVKPDQVELTLENGMLTIEGQRAGTIDEGNEPSRRRIERGAGRFHRRFVLPRTVDQEQVRATSHDGVLEIEIPKQAKAQPRRIEIAA